MNGVCDVAKTSAVPVLLQRQVQVQVQVQVLPLLLELHLHRTMVPYS